MNKAFTANINDQVTARGYLDENDQLIMLEPEMSGGGGGCALSLIVPEQDVTISSSGAAYLANVSADGLSAGDNVMLRVYNSNEGYFYLNGVIESDPNNGLYASFEDFTIGAYQITVRIVFNNGLVTFKNQYSDAAQGTYTVSVIG